VDFDAFLQRATQQEAQNAEAERYARDLTHRIMGEITRRNIPRVIDSDPEFEQRQRQILAARFEDYYRSDADMQPDNYPSDPSVRDEAIRIFAQESVEYTVLNQTSLLSRVYMLITVHDHALAHGATPDYQTASHYKKQLTADLLVLEQYEPDDPWIILVNDLVPGDSLSPDNPQDDPYLLEAYESLANKETEDQQKLEPLHKAYEIAGINYSQPSTQDVEMMSAVAQMMISGMRGTGAENQAAQRQSTLAGIARKHDLAPDITKRLITYIEMTYPL